jgi:hypothetical protein
MADNALALILQVGQKRFYIPPNHRMHQFRGDVTKGPQDEPPFVQMRMGNLNQSFAQDTVIVKQNVQVQNSGTEPGTTRPTSHGILDGLELSEKGFWFKLSANPDNTVYEPVLRFQVDWFCLIQGRLGINHATFGLINSCNALPAIPGLIPNVRSKPYVYCMFTLTLHKKRPEYIIFFAADNAENYSSRGFSF